MAIISEYTSYDATGLADLIQRKEIDTQDVIESAIAQINKRNPNLNAIVEFDFERASTEAQSQIESTPFFGVPFLLKDLLGEDKGRVTTASCPPMKDWKASDDSEMKDNFQSLTKVSIKVPAPLSYRVPDNFDTSSYARFCLDELERTIIDEDPEEVLAFIMEPVGGLSTGALVAPDFYYKQVREICDRYGVLLIYDEVMSGAGRTGKFLAADHWEGSDPDLVILAKGLCAGYSPLGALLAPNKIVEPVVSSGGFLHGHTYASNPLSCAIANAVLNEVIEGNLIENARIVGDYLKKGLERLASQQSIIGDVRGKGLLLAVEIVSDVKTKSMFNMDQRAIYRISELGIKNGILLYTRKTAKGENGEWLMIAPPLISTTDQCDIFLSKLNETLKDFQKEQGII